MSFSLFRAALFSTVCFFLSSGAGIAQNWSYETSSKGVISYTFCGNGMDIPTTGFIVGDSIAYPQGTLDWTDAQKKAVVSALNTIENTFANKPGRTVRVAFAFTNLGSTATIASTALADRIMGGKKTWEQGDLGGNASGNAFINDLDQVWKYGNSTDNPLHLADVVIQINANTILNAGSSLYYGEPGGIGRMQLDFETMILHEMGHALGFYNGWREGERSAFDVLTSSVSGSIGNELWFQGDQTLQYVQEAGNSLFDYNPGASYDPTKGVQLQPRDDVSSKASHIYRWLDYKDVVMPSDGMEGKVRREFSDMELAMFKDMGWTLANDPFVTVPEPGSSSLVILSLALAVCRRRRAA